MKLNSQQNLIIVIFLYLQLISLKTFSAERSKTSFQAGIGYNYSSEYLKTGDNSTPALPIINFETDHFFLKGLTLGYKLYNNWPQINLILNPYMLEIDNEENTYNEEMRKRRRTLHAGIQISIPFPFGIFRAQAEQDILTIHKSNLLSLSYSKRFSLSEKWQLIPGFFYTRQTKTLTNYYFGIQNNEVKPNRSQYTAGNSYVSGPMVNSIYILAPENNLALNLSVKYQFFSKSIKNSPLVKEDHQISSFIGIMKGF